MKDANVKKTINGYLLEWDDSALTIVVKRLDVHSSDGHVTGNLKISNSSKESPVVLLPESQFNFSSDTTRHRTAKMLTEKYPDAEINFVELFDYLGERIQELARTGEEVQEIYAEEDVAAPELLVDPLVYDGVPNILYGEKGVNKSTITNAIGGILSVNWKDNPLGLKIPDREIVPLVLDWETNEYIFRWYLSRIRKGTFDNRSFSMFYRRCCLPLVEELEAVERMIEQTGANLLIIDSLAAAAGGEQQELKGTAAALQFNAGLRKIGLPSLIIGQTSKQQDTDRKTVFGSVMFTYYARNIFELCRGDDDGPDLHLGLFHRECNFARKSSPIGFCVKFNDQNSGISIARETLNVAEFAEKVSAAQRIADILKRGPLNTKEIEESTGLKRNTVDQAMSRLRKQGKIQKVGEKWGLSIAI